MPTRSKRSHRPRVTAAFAVTWDGRLLEQLLPAEPVDAVIDSRKTLEKLRGARRVAFNGTPEHFRELAAAGLLDELWLTWRPRLGAGKSAPTITGRAEGFLPRGIALELLTLERTGGECRARYRLISESPVDCTLPIPS